VRAAAQQYGKWRLAFRCRAALYLRYAGRKTAAPAMEGSRGKRPGNDERRRKAILRKPQQKKRQALGSFGDREGTDGVSEENCNGDYLSDDGR